MFDKMSDLYPHLKPFDEGDQRQVTAALIAVVLKLGGEFAIPAHDLADLTIPEPTLHIWTDERLYLRVSVTRS